MSTPRWKNPDRVLPREGISVPVQLKTSVGYLDAYWHRQPGEEGGAFSNYSTNKKAGPMSDEFWIVFGESIFVNIQFRNIEIYGWAYRVE